MSSSLGGNLYVYFAWNGAETITEVFIFYHINLIYILKSDQETLAIILGIVSVIGSVVFLFGKSIPESERDEEQTLAQACKDYTLSAWYKLFEYEGSLQIKIILQKVLKIKISD